MSSQAHRRTSVQNTFAIASRLTNQRASGSSATPIVCEKQKYSSFTCCAQTILSATVGEKFRAFDGVVARSWQTLISANSERPEIGKEEQITTETPTEAVTANSQVTHAVALYALQHITQAGSRRRRRRRRRLEGILKTFFRRLAQRVFGGNS